MSDETLAAVAVAATVATVRVDTEGGTLARARRVVLPASLLLNCENSLFSIPVESYLFLQDDDGPVVGSMVDIFANISSSTSRGGFGRGRGAAPPS